MKRQIPFLALLCILGSVLTSCTSQSRKETSNETATHFTVVKYNNPGLTSDLGVGLWGWPIPMDFDQDGDMDLLVSCPDKPYNGVYFFENTSGDIFPDFEKAKRLSGSIKNVQISYVNGEAYVLVPGAELTNFRTAMGAESKNLYPSDSIIAEIKKGYPKGYDKNPRFNQWKYVDYENDGDLDIVVGIDDWSDYGWDNAYDDKGTWTNGPLHGYVYLVENIDGKYTFQGRIKAGGKEIDVYGAPTPNFADFDLDGDLDLICGEFLDRFTWFENTGTREKPVYASGKFLENGNGMIKMDLEMIIPAAVDWDGDGDVDLVVGDEDGRVALIENTGKTNDRMPVFNTPKYFRQKADDIKFGALVTPYSVDWDDDGDQDLICGNSAGYICFIENQDGGNPPAWKEPVLLQSNGETIRIQAGLNGSIQGPAERKWGYTTLSVADWDGDGSKDIIINSIWGKVEWFKNTGTKGQPELGAKAGVKVAWEGTPPKPPWNWWDPEKEELAPEWRTIPYAIDWNKDGLMDLVMLDHEGYLAFFERFKKDGTLYLKPGQRIFRDETGAVLRMNEREAGGSGRRKITFVDWDSDGDLDMIANSKNADYFENISNEGGIVTYKNHGNMTDQLLAGHSTSPAIVDWNKDGKPDLVLGAEDGRFYYLKNNQ